MRLEQLVLFGPSDNFTVQFGPRLTVLAGLEDGERSTLIDTMVAAMAGRLPNASVIFVDHAGRRVYADRMGATYAESGVAAPSLAELLGTDPTVIADLVMLRPDDLGLGAQRDEGAVEADLAAARAAHEQSTAAAHEAELLVVQIDDWTDDLEALDRLIDEAPERADRWAWVQLRRELDERRAELASIDLVDDDVEDADARILAAVDELRSAGETWAEASAAAEELSMALGPLPPVSEADLARVAATPEQPPADLDERIDAVHAATEVLVACERAVEAAATDPEDPLDGIVVRLAQLDQEQLWATHAAALAAQAAYDAELSQRPDDTDDEVEEAIEEAHHEVVRAQREVDRRFRPGILGSSALAVTALLAGQSVSILVGVVLLAASVALGAWLLVLPRRELAEALADEERALAHVEAQSWLGLHLRRIDEVMQPGDRKALAAAVDRRATTRLDWEELTGATTLEAAAERREAIEAYAAAIDPAERTQRTKVAAAALEAAVAEEQATRLALLSGLEGFGLGPDGAADLDPAQVRSVLAQRTAAGRFARRVLDLQHHLATAGTAGSILDRLLRQLGFDDGDLAGRLERAIVAVETARRRRGEDGQRTREQLEGEIHELTRRVDEGRRVAWELSDDPTEPPQDVSELVEQRRSLALRLAGSRRPDLADVGRRVALAADRVGTLEQELATIAEGPTSVRRRFADRLARTSWIGASEETLPLLIDDAFVGLDPSELFKLLDMAARLSDRAQIVLLSSDPTVARWARREAAGGIVTLYQADGVALT